jgi:electron transfer flavoprotein beta subunit
MNILVCFKYVYNEEEVYVGPDKTPDVSSASMVVSPYDLNMIEASMKLAAAVGDSNVYMMTVAGDVLDNSKAKKSALSRGPAAMYAVKADGALEMDNLAVASLLKAAVEKVGDVDLVVCGEGSGDMYSQQLGNMLGGMLGWPTLNSVNELKFEDGKVKAVRISATRTETFGLTGKAVVSVTSDISRPRIPSMKEIMGAGKKPVTVWDASEFEGLASVTNVASVKAPPKTIRKNQVFHEADEAEFEEFCKLLKASI